MSEASNQPAARRGMPWRAITLCFVLGSLALVGGLWLFRDAIATAFVRSALRERGLACGPIEVVSQGALEALEIPPAQCTLEEGPIAAVAWSGPIRVTLAGATPSSIAIDEVTVTRRVQAAEPDAGGVVGIWARAPERIGGVVRFASRLAERESPAIAVGRVIVRREGSERELLLEEVASPARERGTPVTLTVATLTIGGSDVLGVLSMPRLRQVEVVADRTRGSLEGSIDARVDVQGLATALRTLALGFVSDHRLRVSVERLDTTPAWSIELR